MDLRNSVKFWCSLVGIQPIEIRDRLFQYNSSLSFYIYNEDGEKHKRLHFHAKINNEKIATIYLDNFEIDFLNSKIKQSNKKIIKEWVEKNIVALKSICINNGKIEIPFHQFVK